MTSNRLLIVNADDFGQCPGVNRGIIQAHQEGIVTSASLMVLGRAAAAAASYSRNHPSLSVGLHLDFGEWVYRNGDWVLSCQVIADESAAAFEAEISRQLQTFRRSMGKYPTHIDSHQHRHLREPACSVVLEIGRRLGVPVRGCNQDVAYCGEFYGQTRKGQPYPENITAERLIEILSGLAPGTTEVSCHPGQGVHLDGAYAWERCAELKALCDPRVRAAIAKMQIELCSFAGLGARLLENAA